MIVISKRSYCKITNDSPGKCGSMKLNEDFVKINYFPFKLSHVKSAPKTKKRYDIKETCKYR